MVSEQDILLQRLFSLIDGISDPKARIELRQLVQQKVEDDAYTPEYWERKIDDMISDGELIEIEEDGIKKIKPNPNFKKGIKDVGQD